MITDVVAARSTCSGQHTGSRGLRARRLCAALTGAFLLPAATGCYTYRHAPDGTLPVGADVALGITDRGRVAVGEQVGPGALRIRGELVGKTDSTYTLSVRRIEYLNGRTAKWSGERVTISRDYVGTAAEQHYSRGRTWLAISGVAAGVALVATAVSLNTSGREGGGTKLPPGGGGQQ